MPSSWTQWTPVAKMMDTIKKNKKAPSGSTDCLDCGNVHMRVFVSDDDSKNCGSREALMPRSGRHTRLPIVHEVS